MLRLAHPDIDQHGDDQDDADEHVDPVLRHRRSACDVAAAGSARISVMTAAPASAPMTVP